jgi:hypothetical protein
MNIKKLVQFGFQTFIVISLLLTNISNAAAQGEDDGGYIGEVSTVASRSLPVFKAGELLQPNASQPLPGGGSATATAQLAWTASRMDGIGRSSLSSNTPGTFSICATAVQLYMNSSPQGGAGQVCASKTGGGSVSSTRSKVVASVFGKSWRVDTSHAFTKSGWGGWFPNLSASVNL